MSITEFAHGITVPEFTHKGSRVLGAVLATDIEGLNSNKPAHALCKGSTTLSEATALYELALAIQLDDDLAGVPEKVAMAAGTVYNSIHLRMRAGEWTDDACDWHNIHIVRGTVVPKNCVPARWVKHPVFERRAEGWQALAGEGSDEMYICLPPEGFVIPTIDGLYRPDTGTPFATEGDREKAVRLLESAGLNGRKEVSYFWGKPLYKGGVCAVSHRRYPSYYGPFAIHVGAEPDFVDDFVGYRPIRRLKETAE
jgi:hypothetical protein